MAEKPNYGIDISVTIGLRNAYGIQTDFEFKRKVSGCEDMPDAAFQATDMLKECIARLFKQIEVPMPRLAITAEPATTPQPQEADE